MTSTLARIAMSVFTSNSMNPTVLLSLSVRSCDFSSDFPPEIKLSVCRVLWGQQVNKIPIG